MEPRLILAYLLMAAMVVAALAVISIALKRHRQHLRVMRGHREWRRAPDGFQKPVHHKSRRKRRR